MLICSKFHDYYDTVMGQGIDKSIVYDRKQSTIDIKIKHPLFEFLTNVPIHTKHHWYKNDDPDMTTFILGFCGMVIPIYGLEYYEMGFKPHFHFSIDSLSKTFKEIGKFEDFDKPKEKRMYFHEYSRRSLIKFEDDLRQLDNEFQKFFIDNHVPIWVIKCSHRSRDYYTNQKEKIRFEILLNPSLKELDFVKLYDPYTTFQEISMYLGGVLGVGNPQTIKIEDKFRASGHGFDKWSFRTPGKKGM